MWLIQRANETRRDSIRVVRTGRENHAEADDKTGEVGPLSRRALYKVDLSAILAYIEDANVACDGN
ncbi:hypothetical protein [Sphingomonas solaris]|uniref:Uncharacterized protein n=1 Tax=Alterirhizorhabdus solaris TaxID=2529389 RepID=A0A558QS40_9SPHN|nr:hypothetical protein [Sphingomonas solaris]TVV69966.1 hypothetical protein FOY91_20275 [Sphingomonas solaris]